jgi:hypothetical protein
MFLAVAALAFGFAILMHLLGWHHGVIDVTLFELIGLLCIALAGLFPGWPPRRR